MKRNRALSYFGRSHLPFPTGPFSVGSMDVMTGYSKKGTLVRLYYPTQETNTAERYLQWSPWIPNQEYIEGLAIKTGVNLKLFKIFKFLFAGDIFIPAIWHGRLAGDQSKHPVIVFSHGLSAWRTAYSTICMEMASHGFVVASLEHRDHSACATFYRKQARMSFCGDCPASYLDNLGMTQSKAENERDVVEGQRTPLITRSESQAFGPNSETTEWIFYQKIGSEDEKRVRKKQLEIRAQECVKVLDLLEDLNFGKNIFNILDPYFKHEMFRGRLDLSKVAVSGHSFGGATTILALAIESRFKVGVALDPWMFPFQDGQIAFLTGNQPFLAINMERFQNANSLKAMSELQRKGVERKFCTIKKAEHVDQCDVNFTWRKWFQLYEKIFKKVDKFTVIDLSSRLMLEFLGKHLDIPIADELFDSEKLREDYLKEETFT